MVKFEDTDKTMQLLEEVKRIQIALEKKPSENLTRLPQSSQLYEI